MSSPTIDQPISVKEIGVEPVGGELAGDDPVLVGLRLIEAGFDELAEKSLAGVTDDELVECLERANRLRNRCDAMAAWLARSCQQRCVAQRRQKRTPAALMASATNVNPEEVRSDTRRGDWLVEYPEFEAAFAAGELSGAHLDVIRHCDTSKTRHQLQCHQEMILGSAESLPFVDFKAYMANWLNAADPDGTLPKEATAKTNLTLRRRPDGSVTLNATFDALSGAVVYGAINDEAQRIWRASQNAEGAPVGTADAAPADGEDTAGAPVGRGQRRAAGLVALLRRGYDNPDAGVRPPLLSIVMSYEVAQQALERLHDPNADVELRWDDIDGRCELLDGTPLHPEYALAVFGSAVFRRFVFDAKKRLIDVSYDSRVFPEWIKHASRVVSRGRCSSVGCDAPFEWMHTDHAEPHNKGGPTRLDNSRTSCGPDNLFKGDKIFDDLTRPFGGW